jgi:hypothetical protein
LRKKTIIVVLAVILILAGLVSLVISFSAATYTQTVINGAVSVPANSTSTEYGVSGPYFLSGSSNSKMNGTLLGYICCVDFYIFSGNTWINWMNNGFNATNSTNSPVFLRNSSVIDSPTGVSTSFTFPTNPGDVYELVFFNTNRSLWHTNSSVVMHVIADINLYYKRAPGRSLLYPGVVLLLAGIALIFVRARYR